MNKLQLGFFCIVIFSSCSMNRYLLYQDGGDEYYLINIIEEASKAGKISRRPTIILDRTIYLNFDFRKHKISKDKIDSLRVLDFKTAKLYYNNKVQGGAIEITTNRSKSFYQKNILYLVDGKALSENDVKSLDAESINGIEVINDKQKMLKYTSENYEKVVIIYIKK